MSEKIKDQLKEWIQNLDSSHTSSQLINSLSKSDYEEQMREAILLDFWDLNLVEAIGIYNIFLDLGHNYKEKKASIDSRETWNNFINAVKDYLPSIEEYSNEKYGYLELLTLKDILNTMKDLIREKRSYYQDNLEYY